MRETRDSVALPTRCRSSFCDRLKFEQPRQLVAEVVDAVALE